MQILDFLHCIKTDIGDFRVEEEFQGIYIFTERQLSKIQANFIEGMLAPQFFVKFFVLNNDCN